MRILQRKSRRLLLFFSLCFAQAVAVAPPSFAQIAIGISVHVGPPALPVYEQPPCIGDGYIWTPGYWSFAGGLYGWHAGYWGPHVGFYGGINYGFGYGGVGF